MSPFMRKKSAQNLIICGVFLLIITGIAIIGSIGFGSGGLYIVPLIVGLTLGISCLVCAYYGRRTPRDKVRTRVKPNPPTKCPDCACFTPSEFANCQNCGAKLPE